MSEIYHNALVCQSNCAILPGLAFAVTIGQNRDLSTAEIRLFSSLLGTQPWAAQAFNPSGSGLV